MTTDNAFDMTTEEGLKAMLAQAEAIRRQGDLVAFMAFCKRLTAETDIYKCIVYTARHVYYGRPFEVAWDAEICSDGDQCNVHDMADDPLSALFNALYRHVYSRIVRMENLTKHPSHFVVDITGDAIPSGRVQFGDDIEDVIEDVISNTLEDELDWSARKIKNAKQALVDLRIDLETSMDIYDLHFELTVCTCADHDHIDFIE